jgi:hypothetical protein
MKIAMTTIDFVPSNTASQNAERRRLKVAINPT